MKREVRQIVFLAFCTGLTVLIFGCAKQQVANEKQARLVSADLQKTIALKDKQIGSLKEAIKKCEDEKGMLQNKSEDSEKALGDEFMKMFEENVKLQEENTALKKQIEDLKK